MLGGFSLLSQSLIIDLFRFSVSVVLVGSVFLEIYPFLLGYLICCHVIVRILFIIVF